MEHEQWLDGYLLGKPGCTKDYKAEWGWWRYQVGGKLFAAVCKPGAEHKDAGRELLTLKCEPMAADTLRALYPQVLPGFYMDKRNWISVCLEGNLSQTVLWELCDRSYGLVFEKLTKKLQKTILEAAAQGH